MAIGIVMFSSTPLLLNLNFVCGRVYILRCSIGVTNASFGRIWATDNDFLTSETTYFSSSQSKFHR